MSDPSTRSSDDSTRSRDDDARPRDDSTRPPDDWPYAAEATVCAACGRETDRSLTLSSLGLVWGAATRGGLAPTDVEGYVGTLEFRCCEACWTGEGIDALEDAHTLVDDSAPAGDGRPFALDDEKVAAAAKLDASRVAVAEYWPVERADPELEHLRAQDSAVESMLDSWFED
ncbi:hypothetical protein [Halorussus halophilus]|uniref:hypothetical protein n=1 Tax=Halorussus halophilus TaxID=2650975 RepID=UPI001301106B|nr:hypothetical protein [Halorussus halophilus]